MKTVTYTPKADQRKWWLIDAEGAVLGRLASTAANLLLGKHKKDYDPSQDHGDFVVIINAEKAVLTGKKRETMRYFNHSQYPGGWRELSVSQAETNRPGYPIRHAIWGMLPHNPRGRALVRKLHIYSGAAHPHAAQKPQTVTLAARAAKS